MNAPAKLIACAAAFVTFHAPAAARQPTVVRASLFTHPTFENGPDGGSFVAHEMNGILAVAPFER